MGEKLIADEECRLDLFLCSKLKISRRKSKYIIENDYVRVNSSKARKNYLLKKGDIIEIEYVPQNRVVPDDSLNLPVIFENEYISAIEKPAGIPVQPIKPDEKGTVANFVVKRYPQTMEYGLSPLSPGILNRLDTLASGIILVAKDHRTFSTIREQFQKKEVKKWFYVVVEGRVENKGKIDIPLAHHPQSSRKMIPVISEKISYRGKIYPALTFYYPEKIGKKRTLLQVKIVTGVTHQIRVHMKYIGHPVYGDPLYGKPAEYERMFIHLSKLSLKDPCGKKVEIVCPPPPEFYEVVE